MNISEQYTASREKREKAVDEISREIHRIECGKSRLSHNDHNHLMQMKNQMHQLKKERYRETLYKGQDFVGYALLNQYDMNLLKKGCMLTANPMDKDSVFRPTKPTDFWCLEWVEDCVKIVAAGKLRNLYLSFDCHILLNQTAINHR